MRLLSDWLRKHFGSKPAPRPVLAHELAPADSVVGHFTGAVVDSFGPLGRIGVSALVVITDRNGDLGALYGSPITPKALRVMAQWADKTLAGMPHPVQQ